MAKISDRYLDGDIFPIIILESVFVSITTVDSGHSRKQNPLTVIIAVDHLTNTIPIQSMILIPLLNNWINSTGAKLAPNIINHIVISRV